jgi:hypothetical protein
MKTNSLGMALAATAFAAASPAPATAAELLAGIGTSGANNILVTFPSDDPMDVSKVKIKGLQKKERILGIDVRPLNGQIYALGSTSRLYVINRDTGVATAVSPTPLNPAVTGDSVAFDFNPTVDRIRIMTDAGQNLRAHPDTGAIVAVDASLAYAGGDPNFADVPEVSACAYTNNDNDPLTSTTLFDIDTANDVVVRQDPPNNGTLNTVGPLGVDAVHVAGFDIAGSNGVAYASLVVKDGRKKNLRATLFTINLSTGAATPVGKIGGPWPLTSLTALGQLAE